VATRLEAIHDKIDANLMRLESEKEHQEKMKPNDLGTDDSHDES
jgi:hypothetical protein